MNKVLSQSEILSLLAEITQQQSGDSGGVSLRENNKPRRAKTKISSVQSTSGKIVTSIERRKQTSGRRPSAFTYESYDFRRPDKLSKDQLRTMQMIHETFSRLFSSSISGYLRTQVQVDLISVEQIAYEEYIKSVSSSRVVVLGVRPLSGHMIRDLQLDLVFTMIDRLLGGTGEGGDFKVGKDLTDIEKVLASNIVRVALADLTTSWENVLRLQYSTVSLDTNAQFIQIVPNNDTVVLLLLEVAIGEKKGQMSFCLPYLLLKPILDKLNAQQWFISKTKKPEKDMAPRLAARLRETAKVPCIARLGVSQVTVETIVNLKVGQLLPLRVTNPAKEEAVEQSGQPSIGVADILIGNQIKFRGRIGLKGKRRLAVMVDEVMPPAQELVSYKEVDQDRFSH
jgi:flagellar motor switch protein FliM